RDERAVAHDLPVDVSIASSTRSPTPPGAGSSESIVSLEHTPLTHDSTIKCKRSAFGEPASTTRVACVFVRQIENVSVDVSVFAASADDARRHPTRRASDPERIIAEMREAPATSCHANTSSFASPFKKNWEPGSRNISSYCPVLIEPNARKTGGAV